LNVDITKELPTVLSFCSGYGGIERGLDLAGVEHRVIAYVEIEAYAIANLANKMEAGKLSPAPIWSNLKTLPVEPFRNRVDLITGGYPCQPFSAAGKRLGEDDPRHLWPYIMRHIESIRPVRCFFENVEGHISLGLREVISDLESLGYKTTWGIFSAREVGAPHQRKRVYILADSTVNGDRGALRAVSSKDDRVRESEEYREGESVKSFDAGEDGAFIMADSNNGQRELKDEEIRARWDSAVDGGKYLADTESLRVQGLRPSGVEKSDSPGQAKLSLRQSQRTRYATWDAEPELGRVVDGCADRVDRIRLLGNSVVPATAAKAWRVLNDRM